MAKKIDTNNKNEGKANDLTPFNIIYQGGEYNFFYRHKKGGSYHIAQKKSHNLISWKNARTITSFGAIPRSKGRGTAVLRHQKIHIIYHKKGLFDGQKLITYKGIGEGIEKYPLPLIPKSKVSSGKCAQIFFSGTSYHMLLSYDKILGNKSSKLKLFSSPNLINWDFNFDLASNIEGNNNTNKYYNPSLVGVDGNCFLIYSDLIKGGKKGITVALLSNLDIENGYFELLDKSFVLSGIHSPRTSVLEGGRVLLLGTTHPIRGKSVMLTPRELVYQDETLYQQPIKELAEARREGKKAELSLSKDFTAVYGYPSCQETIIDASMDNATHIDIDFGNGLSFSYSKLNGMAKLNLVEAKKEQAVDFAFVGATNSILLNIFLLEDKIEIFINGGIATLSKAVAHPFDGSIKLKAKGGCFTHVSCYKLDI